VAQLKLLFEGRGGLGETLSKYLSANTGQLSLESKQLLKEKWGALQRVFVSDEGQSIFLQALARVRRKDCAGALAPLDQALGWEKGNIQILWEKARCENVLGSHELYYETIKSVFAADPFSLDALEAVMEAHIYFGQFEKVLTTTLLWKEEGLRSPKARTAFALALLETGNLSGARAWAQPLLDRDRSESLPPIVYFLMGKILVSQAGMTVEATGYLERFLSSVEITRRTETGVWDPYRTTSRAEEAKKLLTELKTRAGGR